MTIWTTLVTSVGTATGYLLDDGGAGSRMFSSSRPDFLFFQWLPGALVPELEADHSLPATAEVKKAWVYTFTPSYALVKHRDNFTFLTLFS
jgi:hypothetical protein